MSDLPAEVSSFLPPLPLQSEGRAAKEAEVRRRVLELYAEVDRAVAAAGPKCDASGRCCRFKEYGHTLFLSGLEADLLLASAPPYEQPVSADFCPFQKGTLCTAREPRPLGCRIFFCDSSYQDTGNALTEAALRRLKELADRHGLGWRYAPLHVFLNQAAERSSATESGEGDVGRRRPLPQVGIGPHVTSP